MLKKLISKFSKKCTWKTYGYYAYVSVIYTTACDHAFILDEFTNGDFLYCPYCGRAIDRQCDK